MDSVQWVTGEHKHFVFRLTPGSNSGSTEQSSRATSASGGLAFRELDEAFRLTQNAGAVLSDPRHGKNTRHTLLAMPPKRDEIVVPEASGAGL